MSNLTCSPKVSETSDLFTCYSLNELKNIAKNYNKQYPSNKINLKLPKKKLWEALKEKNFDNCQNNEFCWLKQNYMKINKNIEKYKENFRPEKPKDWENEPNKWLNTYDILDVMNQYQDKYNDFKFIGVFPIDFRSKIGSSCVSPIMCSLNLKQLHNNKIKRLGFVFNLDKHWQSGSHWTSLYINFNKNSNNYGAYYYDSTGNKPPVEIFDFIKIIKKQINNLFINSKKEFKFTYNKIMHQTGGSECGIFSIYFLDKSLKNISFNNFVNNKKLNDNYVFKYRNKFYTPSN